MCPFPCFDEVFQNPYNVFNIIIPCIRSCTKCNRNEYTTTPHTQLFFFSLHLPWKAEPSLRLRTDELVVNMQLLLALLPVHQDNGWIPAPGLSGKTRDMGITAALVVQHHFRWLSRTTRPLPHLGPGLPTSTPQCFFLLHCFWIPVLYTILFLWLLLIYGFSCLVAFAHSLLSYFSQFPLMTLRLGPSFPLMTLRLSSVNFPKNEDPIHWSVIIQWGYLSLLGRVLTSSNHTGLWFHVCFWVGYSFLGQSAVA